jgi:hypothetical protein
VSATFAKLCEIADWSGSEPTKQDEPKDEDGAGSKAQQVDAGPGLSTGGALQLHRDIHVHLPATSDAAVYRAIFQAIKSELT